MHKLLAKMGVSLVQCKQNYTHMDMVLKRELRTKLLKYASLYNLDELVPTTSIRTARTEEVQRMAGGLSAAGGWRATLSAQDVGVVVGALLEVGKNRSVSDPAPSAVSQEAVDLSDDRTQSEEWLPRFWEAHMMLSRSKFCRLLPYLLTERDH